MPDDLVDALDGVIADTKGRLAEAMFAADQAQPVYCDTCRNSIRRLDGKDLSAYRWLCGATPRNLKPNFVSQRLLIEEPYYRCSIINDDGQCSRFEPMERANV